MKRSAAIWLPPRTVGERALVNDPSLVVMLPATGGGQSARWGRMSLEALPALKSAVLVFDARDVTLMHVKLPPLSGARLAHALPNLLEDSLLQDTQSCAFALGPREADGRRMVAVIDRGWLEFVAGAFERRGVSLAGAWPAQLAMPLKPGGWSVVCVHDAIALRTGESDGFGWSASGAPQARVDALSGALQAAGHGVEKPSSLSAFTEDAAWQESVERAAQAFGVPVAVQGLAVPARAPVDLLSARQGSAGGRWLGAIDWRAWRLPAALAVAAVVAFLIGLNLHWGRLASERVRLRAQMEATFRQAFPGAQVVVDPLLQMQRQVSDLRAGAGQSGPDDFLPLLAKFSAALGPRGVDAMAAVEFRDGRLKARLRGPFLEGPAARETLRKACQQQGLSLKFEGEGDAIAVVGVQS